tara:strand:- start:979 stop:3123 length:2145 start_codon:yes stop_codon:yes gene_type:complete
MKLNKQNNFSSFWLGDTLQNNSLIEKDIDTKPGIDHIKLASYQRAISNFVNIVTAQNIPVQFSQRGDSYTDGKVVTISSKLDDKLFDSSVGLALHEGSHILLSDFDFLKTLGSTIPKTTYALGMSKGMRQRDIREFFKNMLNFVEDRRIDHYVVSSSPGYKGYYLSMYQKYFNSPTIDKGLKSDEMTELTLDSYMFRIINLTNPNTNLDALPGLRDIWNTMDLRNVSRLQSTGDAWKVAYKIGKIVLQNLDDTNREETYSDIKKRLNQALQQSMNQQGGSSTGGSEGQRDMINDYSVNRIKDLMQKYQDSNDYERLLDSVQVESVYLQDGGRVANMVERIYQELENGLSDDEKSDLRKKLDRVFDKQKKFIDGKISKRKLSKKDKQKVQAISESGTTLKDILKDSKYDEMSSRWMNRNTGGKKQCIVVRNFNQTLVDSGMFRSLIDSSPWRDTQVRVVEGLRLGKMLGKKLQIRGEERLLKNTRLNSGRIDKRLIAELGFGNSNVFHTIDVDKYPDGFLHISLDASGSMSGEKFNKSLTCAIAIIQAVDMIPNFDVVFSLRGTQDSHTRNGDLPVIMYAYDSRVDKISKVRNLFQYLHCGSTTPEGLCFEAIMDDMITTTDKMDSFFLNLSDGMPMYSNDTLYYCGDEAVHHTRDMVNKMRKMGINILSYFISDYDRDTTLQDFKTMYGQDAENINVSSVTQIAKTMNNMFLSK